jgi:hypothetical protein
MRRCARGRGWKKVKIFIYKGAESVFLPNPTRVKK